MPDQFRVVCGTCGVNPEILTSDLEQDEVACPVCGQRDKAEVAMSIAQEHLHYQAQTAFQAGLEAAVRGREFIRLNPEPLTPREFRWRVASI